MDTLDVKCTSCVQQSNKTYTITFEGQVDHHLKAAPIIITFQGRAVPLTVGEMYKIAIGQ